MHPIWRCRRPRMPAIRPGGNRHQGFRFGALFSGIRHEEVPGEVLLSFGGMVTRDSKAARGSSSAGIYTMSDIKTTKPIRRRPRGPCQKTRFQAGA